MINSGSNPFQHLTNLEQNLDTLSKIGQGKSINETPPPVAPPKTAPPPKAGKNKESFFRKFLPKMPKITNPSKDISEFDYEEISAPILDFVATPIKYEPSKVRELFTEVLKEANQARLELGREQDPAQKKLLEKRIAELESKFISVRNDLDKLLSSEKYSENELRELQSILESYDEAVTDGFQAMKSLVSTSLKDVPKETLQNPPPRVELGKAREAFKNHLNEKCVGHLVGDAFLKDMRDPAGKSLEGNNFSNSISFMLKALDFIPQKHSEKFAQHKGTLDLMRVKLSQALRYSEKIEKDRGKSPAKLAEEIHQDVEKLQDGQTILIPSGWSVKGGTGHAILVELTKVGTDVLMRVINTGEGSQFHQNPKDSAKYVNTVQEFRLSINEMKNEGILERLLEMKTIMTHDDLMKGSREFGADELYAILDPYRQPANEGLEGLNTIMKAQLSGTCSLRCLMAYAAMKLGGNYKDFKNLWERETIQTLLENPDSIKQNPPLRAVLAKAIPNLFRHLDKEIKKSQGNLSPENQKIANELLKLKEEFERVFPQSSSEHDLPSPGPERIADHTTEVSKAVKNCPTPLSDRKEQPVDRTKEKPLPPTLQITSNTSAAELLNHLQVLNDYCGTYRLTHESHAVRYLRLQAITNIGRIFTDPDKAEIKAKILAELGDDPTKVENFLSILLANTIQMEKDFGTATRPLSYTIACHEALAVGYVLAQKLDQIMGNTEGKSIAYWGLETPALDLYQRCESFPSVYDPEIEADFKHLANFFKTSRGAGSLFDRSNFEMEVHPDDKKKKNPHYRVMINKNCPDVKYIQKNIDPETRAKALTDKAKYRKECNPDLWVTNWAYANNKLPIQYRLVRNLHIMASSGFPNPFASPKDYEPLATDQRTGEVELEEDEFPTIKTKLGDVLTTAPQMPVSSDFAEGNARIDADVIKNAIHPISQNIVSVNFSPEDRELRSLLSVKTPLQIPMVIDYFSTDLHRLSQPSNQAVLSSILFQTSMLSEIYSSKESSFIVNDLRKFIDKALEQYENTEIPPLTKAQVQNTYAFLLNTQIKLLNFEKRFGSSDEGIDDRLKEARMKASAAVNSPEAKNDSNYLQTNASNYIETFMNSPSMKPEEAHRLILCSCRYWKSKEQYGNALYNKEASEHLASVMSKLAPELRQHEIPEDVLKQIFENYQLDPNTLHDVNSKNFPTLSARNSNNKLLEINLLTGEARMENTVMRFDKLSSLDMGHPLYKAAFGNETLIGKQLPRYFEGTDKQGYKVRLNLQIASRSFQEEFLDEVPNEGPVYDSANSSIQKEIDGTWYEFKIGNPHPGISRLANRQNLQLWLSTDKKKPEALLINKNTSKVEYRVDEKGWFSFGTDATQYRFHDYKSTKDNTFINTFGNDAIVWQPAIPGKGTPILEFPSFLDKNGESLKFVQKSLAGSSEPRWVLQSDENYYIAPEQKLAGLDNFNNFLVIQNAKGSREALIPQKYYLEQHPSSESLKARLPAPAVRLDRYKLNENGKLEPKAGDVAQNALAAYHLYSHAVFPEDYLQVIPFLQECKKYSRFSPEELKAFGWIFNQEAYGHKKDSDPNALAVKLYVAWMVHDNFSRYPELNPSKEYYPPENEEEKQLGLVAWSHPGKWEEYWVKLNDSKFGFAAVRGQQLRPVLQDYLVRQNNVHEKLKINKLISSGDLVAWGLLDAMKARTDVEEPRVPNSSDILNPSEKPRSMGLFEFRADKLPDYKSRLGSDLVKHFDHLMVQAQSPKIQTRNRIKKILRDSQFDTRNENILMRNLLAFNLAISESKPKWREKNGFTEFQKDARAFLKEKEILLKPDKKDYQSVERLRETYNKLLNNETFKEYLRDEINVTRRVDRSAGEALRQIENPLENEPKTLKLPDNKPGYNPLFSYPKVGPKNLFQANNDQFKKFFSPSTEPVNDNLKLSQKDRHFSDFGNKNPSLQKAVGILNSEISAGIQRNRDQKGASVKIRAKETAQKLLAEYRPGNKEGKLGREISEGRARQQELKKEIEKMANEEINENIKLQVQVQGGQRTKLELDDVLVFILQKDINKFKEATGIQDEQKIQAIVEKTILFLELSATNIQKEKLEDALVDLKSADDDSREELLGNVGSILNEKHDLSSVPSAIPILIYEYKMRELNRKIILKEDQIAGLGKMMESEGLNVPSIFMHRIQAGGKTLVWGQLMALLKADGYHLSLHISPTQLYTNNLNDMAFRSKALFGQNVNTLIFDDHPQYFSSAHLRDMKHILENAIMKGEYVNTTNESLRALRDKYIKVCLDASSNQAPDANKNFEVRESLKLMREILSLLRTRGVFTFDEVHLAMDPRKLLNMPSGEIEHPDPIQSNLISQIIRHAAACDERGRPLFCDIRANQQSQQTDEQRKNMLSFIAGKLLDDSKFRDQLGLAVNGNVDQAKLEKVKAYMLNKQAPLPQEYQKDGPATQLLLLAHCMLAEGWLSDALSKNVHEHHGIVREAGKPPISGPFNANKTPAKGSEFSDVYVKTTYTYIAYLVEGLSLDQAAEFADRLKQKSFEEYKALKKQNPSAKLEDTPTAKRFAEFAESCGIGQKDLFTLNYESPAMREKLVQGLKANKDIAAEMLLEYINDSVISKIEIYPEEVSANGQNTATMGKAVNGYTGSMDNPQIAPTMDPLVPKTISCQPEKGVNGQTIDLLVNKNNEVWIVDQKPESLFAQLINNLKPEQQTKVRAIIDIGCQFRGMDNYQAAKMINEKLNNDDVKGILFFDNNTGDMCFINRGNPGEIKVLKGTDPATVERETGLPPEKLFTFYSQEKITGTDVVQMKDALAIATVSEGTEIPQFIQGVRRMRGLDKFQGVITAVQKGTLDQISSELGPSKASLKNLETGKKVNDTSFIKDVLAFTQLNEIRKEEKDSLALCMQKCENLVQQFLLDKVYKGELEQDVVFNKAADLFRRKVAQDLFREYAAAKEQLPAAEYLEMVKKSYLRYMENLSFQPGHPEYDAIKSNMDRLIQEALPHVQRHVEVNRDSSNPDALRGAVRNREAQMVQFRVAEAKAVNQNVQANQNINQNVEMNVNQNVNQNVRWNRGANPAFEAAFDLRAYFDKQEPKADKRVISGPLVTLDRCLRSAPVVKGTEPTPLPQFGEEIIVTRNYLTTRLAPEGKTAIDVSNGYRKPIHQMGILEEADGKLKFIIGSTSDLVSISNTSKTGDGLPEGAKAWVVRPSGELASSSKFDFSKTKDRPEFRRGMVKILFYSGKADLLEQPEWLNELQKWLAECQPAERKALQTFFEDVALNKKITPQYAQSKLKKLIGSEFPQPSQPSDALPEASELKPVAGMIGTRRRVALKNQKPPE